MYYVIQENLFKEYHFNTLVEYLKRYGLEYEIVKWRPFTDIELEYKTKRKDVWFFGSVVGARKALDQTWVPGSLYNDSHDWEVYAPHWKGEMLNEDGMVVRFGEGIPDHYPEVFFARPTKDTKVFSGGPMTKSSWEKYIRETIETGMYSRIGAETKVLIAPLKQDIQQEIRCWIVDGEVVTISQYKIGRRVVYQNHDNNEEALIYAKSIVKKYQPAKAFVLDICLYEDEYKVVEVNCINCSGFYDGDMSKLIQALEKTFS